MLATDWWDYGYGEGYEHDDDVMAKEVEQFTQRLLAYDLRLVELPRRPRKWLKRLRGDPPIRYGLEWRVDADSDWVLAVPLNEASFPWNLPQPRDDSSGGN